MGERTKYAPGTFCWTDLTTSDQEGAKSFYTQLFGWEATNNPVGEGMVYTTMSVDGKGVAAVSSQPQAQREAGVPPAWNSYISVDSADDALAKAKELGATVHADAFDVFDLGRMGVVQDPQGAFFEVWQPGQTIGAAYVNAPGALSWNELATPDMDASASFYGQLFGWKTESVEGMAMPYRTITTSAGNSNGGMRPPQGPEPPNWLVYFGSDDVDADLAKVTELGGGKMTDAVDIGPGKIAIVTDPQGAVFALYGGQFAP
jgi:predicted enzyme related to lactoylglutathione lyase